MKDSKGKQTQAVVAFCKEAGRLKGIELRMKRETFELVWAKTAQHPETDWSSFATECGVSRAGSPSVQAGDGNVLVVGFSSAGTVFHRASVPSVEAKELASIVQFQAETRLPLPAEQTELAWRVDPTHNGQMDVTMAVARKELLRRFAQDVQVLDPNKIRLDCEAMVKVWAAIFTAQTEKAIVISVGHRNTHVCLVEHARLSNAVILDSGVEDFTAGVAVQADNAGHTPPGLLLDAGLEGFSLAPETQAEMAERFAQDVRSVIEFFGYAATSPPPIFLLSDNSEVYARIASSLRSAGLNAQLALPDGQRIDLSGDIDLACVYAYRVPIGLGLMGLDGHPDELDLFRKVYRPLDRRAKQRRFLSPKVAGAMAAVMLLGMLGVSYVVDLKSPTAIRAQIEASTADVDTTLDALVERQSLIKTVARERPDMLALLTVVNASGDKGVVLDSLHFKKGQKVTITGQVENSDQLYAFHEKLREHKDLAEVIILSTGKGGGGEERSSGGRSKGKGITFTITFQYKHFGKKAKT